MQTPIEKKFTKKLILVIQNNDGLVVEVSDNDNDNLKTEETTPSDAKMRECLGLEKTRFQKMDMFNAMKAEVNDHLRKAFPPRQASFHRFLYVE